MGKEKTLAGGGLVQEFFQGTVYKRSQGRIARQVTFGVLAAAFALAAWRLFTTLQVSQLGDYRYIPSGLVLVLGVWFSFRLVNLPRFADFLIAVEAEMNKVSWPSRTELYRSSVVVILVMFFLAFVLFGYDLFWRTLFVALGVMHGRG